ncbi:FAD-dependent oxidoreductase [Halostagnicola kamekurae]|uniref:Pyridine nucleotide-disulphide oxidoreductase n=1 Tax=Halostagnicola kamekurae TaxID=619731 RepID=A0A1I6TIS0_9EURY|nr:FAD-dependent oxidoreductase [Halostagnicola kamekurae]SFS89113.1 Pyridine nucleotide-disulphide oxidoreductase [Halostagnicola kamekurae]
MTDRSSESTDYDVVIVGGGPAGCAAGVFTARYGLETAVFDRGAAPLRRCAHLENYLGFPAGIDIDSFYDLIHAQVEEAGCDLVADTVDTVDRGDDTERFVVDPQDAASVTATVVVAATWYDGEYLRPLGGDAMFETHDHDGEEHEHFDPAYADADGRTPIDGLYVASPAGQRSTQAVVAAGHGAHVGRCVLADRRREEGYPDGVAEHYDWLRRDAEFSGEWNDRDRWRDWFDDEAGEDHGLSDERYERLRERYIDRAFETRVSETSADERSRRGLGRLLETIGTDRVLDAIDDETIEAYVRRRRSGETGTD